MDTSMLAHLRARPGMYLHGPATYASITSVILGMELAGSAVVVGFNEWLIPRGRRTGSNLRWTANALFVMFPLEENPYELPETSPERDREAFDRLFDLLDAFHAARREPYGLRRIYLEYENWLRSRRWYQPDSPDYIEVRAPYGARGQARPRRRRAKR